MAKKTTTKVTKPSGRNSDGTFAEGNQLSIGNEGGVETKYKKEFNEQAYNYCLLGATDKQLGDFFNVCEATINNWKKEFPEFLESIRAGKEYADMRVANSLFQNCLGANIMKQKEVKRKAIDPETSKVIEVVEVVDLQEQLPPDTNAIKFWLSNRQRNNWNDRVIQQQEGNKDNPVVTESTTKVIFEDYTKPNKTQ